MSPKPSYVNSQRRFDEFEKYRQEDCFTDFTIHSHGAIIRCHKIILATESDYFATMLKSDMSESAEGVMICDSKKPNVVEGIVKYLYGQTVVIPRDEVDQYLDLAEMFLLKGLKEEISAYIGRTLVVSNELFEHKKLSKLYSLDCHHEVNKLLMEKFEVLASTPGFKNLTFAELLDISSAANFESNADERILRLWLTWIRKDKPNRGRKLKDCVERVNLRKCNLEDLRSVVEDFKDILESDQKLNDIVTSQKEIKEMESTNILMICGQNLNQSLNLKLYSVDIYNKKSEEVKSCGKHAIGLFNRAVALKTVSPGFLSGKRTGSDSDENMCCIVGRVAMFDFHDFPSFEPETLVGVTEVDTSVVVDVYVFLKCGEHCVKGFVIEGGYLEPLPAIYTSHYSSPNPPVFWAIGELVFVLIVEDDGTRRTRSRTLNLYSWDTNTDRKRRRNSPPITALLGAKLVVAQNHAYVVGGEDSLNLRYDPLNDHWQELAKPQEMDHGSAFHANGSIYLCGVEQFGHSVMQEYSIATNQWKESELPVPPLKDHACVAYKVW